MRKITLFLVMLIAVALAGCSGGDPAAETVEAYLEAIVSQDDVAVSNLSCEEWEFDAMMEMDSFLAVSPELKDVACAVSGTDESATLVDCTGSIVATYNDEQQELDLSVRTYQVIEEAGEWVVCGYH